MAEITFLAPGSCQLEVTAQGNVGADTGVDLASVSWTIEQALIAGCRFSPSAGDVHIDRNGVLTIGRSLFDRINQADGDDAIPGQCTLVIRADSTITRTVLDRFKILVGYPGEGGGSGGGGGEVETREVRIAFLTETDIGFAAATQEDVDSAIDNDPIFFRIYEHPYYQYIGEDPTSIELVQDDDISCFVPNSDPVTHITTAARKFTANVGSCNYDSDDIIAVHNDSIVRGAFFVIPPVDSNLDYFLYVIPYQES